MKLAGYLMNLRKQKRFVTINLAANEFKTRGVEDQDPLYHLDGIIEKVGEDFLLLDCGDVMAFEHDKVIVAIPFYSIAFIEEN